MVGFATGAIDLSPRRVNLITGILVVSSDLGELLLLCDRISVVVDGRIIKTFKRGELGDAEELHHLIQLAQTPDEHAA